MERQMFDVFIAGIGIKDENDQAERAARQASSRRR